MNLREQGIKVRWNNVSCKRQTYSKHQPIYTMITKKTHMGKVFSDKDKTHIGKHVFPYTQLLLELENQEK